MNILLLEDNTIDAGLTQRSLSHAIADCKVDVASTIKKAKQLLHENPCYDVALLDMNLPDGNGLEILMEIRQLELKMAVVILTGSVNEEVAVAALKAGADDYVVKHDEYIDRLPQILRFALDNFRQSLRLKSEIINVLYIEYHSVDIDLTLRHLNKYAPYIHLETLPTAEVVHELLISNKNGLSAYHVILIDYRLPGMTALEFIKMIRQEYRLCIPIILVTGQGNEEVAIESLKLGANDYLAKGENYYFRLPSLITNVYQHEELIKKQAALVESEKMYRLLADNSADVIFVLDTDLNYSYISPSVKALRGFEPEEAIIQKVTEVLTPDSYLRISALIAEIIAGNIAAPDKPVEPIMMELEMVKKDHTTVWTEIKASLILNDQKKPIGILGSTRDISIRKKAIDELIKAKEKAEESDRLKSAFLSNISHEIRTPMNGILGFADILKEPDLSGEERNEFISIIEKSAARMLNIISEIVDIAMIESCQIVLDIKLVEINEQIDLVYDFFQLEAEEKGLKLFTHTDSELNESILKTDKDKLQTILINLMKNAIKYTETGSVEFGYTIDVSGSSSFFEFFVKDTGIGIPKDRLEAIFHSFVQADISDKMAKQGAGLGLTITKSFVEILGGRIWLESEEGKGTTFYFTLPVERISERH
jgi:PAS domain S-box-containing protein